MKYYYLVASLPFMVIGDSPPFSLDEFRFRCGTLLDEADLAELDLILAGDLDSGSTSFARQWRSVETQLRNALARTRAGESEAEAKTYMQDHEGFSVFIEESVTDAYAKSDPLGREMAIDKCRWQLLDDLAREEAYGLSAVLAFAVKLQIVARWASLSDEAGHKRFDELVTSGLERSRESSKDDKTDTLTPEAES